MPVMPIILTKVTGNGPLCLFQNYIGRTRQRAALHFQILGSGQMGRNAENITVTGSAQNSAHYFSSLRKNQVATFRRGWPHWGGSNSLCILFDKVTEQLFFENWNIQSENLHFQQQQQKKTTNLFAKYNAI